VRIPMRKKPIQMMFRAMGRLWRMEDEGGRMKWGRERSVSLRGIGWKESRRCEGGNRVENGGGGSRGRVRRIDKVIGKRLRMGNEGCGEWPDRIDASPA
jgi:hypothetical protein